jgi:predicted ribosomally synthesized peptide with SipW-like signal peptide
MSKKRLKQYLMLLTVVGLVAVAAGGGSGTFASFSAEVTNANNTFAAGTLYLHDNGGTTTCTSESSSDNLSTNNCDVLFTAGDLTAGAQTADLTLSNAGTIPASDIKFKVANCTWGDNSAVTGSSVLFGSTPTCGNMWITIQEVNASGGFPGSNIYCAYGTDSAGTCAAPSNSFTLGNSTSFTDLKTTAAANATFTAMGGATDTRYYIIKVQPNPALQTGNTLQNRTVTFDLTWHIDQ